MPEQAPGQVFIKKRQVTHPYGVSPHDPPTSHEIPINDLGAGAGRCRPTPSAGCHDRGLATAGCGPDRRATPAELAPMRLLATVAQIRSILGLFY
jgi:hypothetical protein